jgi:hypothetical protein
MAEIKGSFRSGELIKKFVQKKFILQINSIRGEAFLNLFISVGS